MRQTAKQCGTLETPHRPKPCPLSQSQGAISTSRRNLGGDAGKVSTCEARSGLPDHSRRRTGGIGQHLGADGQRACLDCCRHRRPRPASLALMSKPRIFGPLLQRCAEGRASASG